MSNLVPADEIEQIVGMKRHATRHYARAISAERVVYILHSQRCKDGTPNLRDCLFSLALDKGIDEEVWADAMDKPVRVTINRSGRLIHSGPGMRADS